VGWDKGSTVSEDEGRESAELRCCCEAAAAAWEGSVIFVMVVVWVVVVDWTGLPAALGGSFWRGSLWRLGGAAAAPRLVREIAALREPCACIFST
jgi:hypothetical protein